MSEFVVLKIELEPYEPVINSIESMGMFETKELVIEFRQKILKWNK